jgi:hypothetical protein
VLTTSNVAAYPAALSRDQAVDAPPASLFVGSSESTHWVRGRTSVAAAALHGLRGVGARFDHLILWCVWSEGLLHRVSKCGVWGEIGTNFEVAIKVFGVVKVLLAFAVVVAAQGAFWRYGVWILPGSR